MRVSRDLRELIVRDHNQGLSLRKIAKKFNKSHSTVQYVLKRYRDLESLEDRRKTGRPRKLESHHRRCIIAQINENPQTSATSLASGIHRDYGIKVHPETVRNVLRTAGFRGRTARRKPFISKVNKKKRLLFAKEFVNKPESFWKNVIFSDESKFNLFGADGRSKVWRKPKEAFKTKNLLPTVKHGGGSVMVWGCLSSSGVGNLVFIDGIMDQYGYLNILRNNLKQSAEKLGLGCRYVFQQDNDPKHTAKRVKEWLIHNVPKQLKTPPQSPDLNPIEHLWDELGRRVKNHNTRTKEELKTALQTEWNTINNQVTKKLVMSMRNRLLEIVKAKGGPTSY